jgi:hypothetical protein
VSRRLGDDWLVASAGIPFQCYRLTGSSARAWELLDRPRTIAEVANELALMFRGDRESLEEDVGRMLEELHERACVEMS